MKNANSNITTQHTTYHGVFDPAIPELVDEHRKFVAMANEYLAFQPYDVCYHASKTRGQSKHRIIKVIVEHWKFVGEILRESQPYTDTVELYYYNQKVWEMKRTITFLPSDSSSREEALTDKVKTCVLAAARSHDQGIPWCGPRYYNDDSCGLHYEARYSSDDDISFTIEESVSDYANNVVWAAVCKGGYV